MGKLDDLVLECTQMIAADGLESFSLRKLADRVGIKAPSIYEHFKNKDALLDAARHMAMTELSNAMVNCCAGRSARQRLLSTAMGYLQFAENNPSLFALLFLELPSKRQGLEDAPHADSPYALLMTRVREFLGENHKDTESLCFGIWSLVHGVAVLRHTHLKDFPAPLPKAAQKNLEALLDGWA